ncbi:MAG: DNA methyltransferase [Candidatus Peregrinibacteria bacterium]
MNLYAFELGRKKELCFAELLAVFGEKSLRERNLDTAIFSLSKFDPRHLQNSLGGTIKIIEIVDEFSSLHENEIHSSIQTLLEKHLKGRSGKIPFSVTALGFKNPREINIKDLLNFSKKILKSFSLNSRFVNKDFRSPAPSTIYKAKVVEKGVDINIIKGNSGIFLGRAISIQNIDAYSLRDYEKPRRAASVGMLPPKLAQIMINLVGPTDTIYDPFCGTGTVLTEAMLMGKTAIGSDLDVKMVEFTETNCLWLRHEFRATGRYRVFQRDARFITKNQLPEAIDAIITEGYLGKLHTALPSEPEREKIFRELALLHLNWLRAVHSATPKTCRTVMCLTAFRVQNRLEHFPRFQELANEAGWKITETFTYDRPDQIVARDIVILDKK